jgi:hypothetical protein
MQNNALKIKSKLKDNAKMHPLANKTSNISRHSKGITQEMEQTNYQIYLTFLLD